MAWIEVHQSLIRHRKILSVGQALDIPRMSVVGHMVALWLWCLDNAENGDLTGLHPSVITAGAEWIGDSEVFINALTKAGFLDRTADTLQIHNWHEYAGRLIERRQRDADRKRAQRTSAGHPRDVPKMSDATVPYRTLPYPTIERESAVAPQTALAASKPRKVKEPAKEVLVDDLFRKRMVDKYNGTLTDINERIDEALAHENAQKWPNKQLYVQGWLRRDLERKPMTNTANRTTRVEASHDRDIWKDGW